MPLRVQFAKLGVVEMFGFANRDLTRRDSTYKATPGTGNLSWVALAKRAEVFKQPRGQMSFRGLLQPSGQKLLSNLEDK